MTYDSSFVPSPVWKVKWFLFSYFISSTKKFQESVECVGNLCLSFWKVASFHWHFFAFESAFGRNPSLSKKVDEKKSVQLFLSYTYTHSLSLSLLHTCLCLHTHTHTLSPSPSLSLVIFLLEDTSWLAFPWNSSVREQKRSIFICCIFTWRYKLMEFHGRLVIGKRHQSVLSNLQTRNSFLWKKWKHEQNSAKWSAKPMRCSAEQGRCTCWKEKEGCTAALGITNNSPPLWFLEKSAKKPKVL
jgi:hypothetical protein